MQNINVRRYSNPTAVGYAGWIEPADKTWIAFIGLDGSARFYLERDESGAVVTRDEPATLPTP